MLGHSGGSSSNTRFQITADTREASSVASAPVPASSPDQSSRFTSGLSVIGAGFNQTLRLQMEIGRAEWARSSAIEAAADRVNDQRLRALELVFADRLGLEDPAGQNLFDQPVERQRRERR